MNDLLPYPARDEFGGERRRTKRATKTKRKEEEEEEKEGGTFSRRERGEETAESRDSARERLVE